MLCQMCQQHSTIAAFISTQDVMCKRVTLVDASARPCNTQHSTSFKAFSHPFFMHLPSQQAAPCNGVTTLGKAEKRDGT